VNGVVIKASFHETDINNTAWYAQTAVLAHTIMNVHAIECTVVQPRYQWNKEPCTAVGSMDTARSRFGIIRILSNGITAYMTNCGTLVCIFAFDDDAILVEW
jgi:hypothetical protein